MAGRAFTAAPAMLLVTIIYLVAVLSIPIFQPQKLIWLGAYPIMASEITGIGFLKVLLRSLWILPLVVVIGIFNPILDTETAFVYQGMVISKGWLSLVSIILRGLLSFQALIILIMNTGLINVFNSFSRLGIPSILTTQMLLTYRYIIIIAGEAIVMKRAREARGYGRSNYPIKEWERFVGLLMIRSTNRAKRIHQAMKARGFEGVLPLGSHLKWTISSWLWAIGWVAAIAFLRFYDLSRLFLQFSHRM